MLGIIYVILFSIIFLSLFALEVYTIGKISDKLTDYLNTHKDSKEKEEE